MKFIAHMVTHNEAGRYLRDVLWWLNTFVDDVFVYDDQSTDGTVELLETMGAHYRVRSDECPAFREDEGGFRQSAWNWLTLGTKAEGGACEDYRDSWVLCIDADEFLVSTKGTDVREELERLARYGLPAARFKVEEVFGVESGTPMIRKDGFWGDIWASRLVRFGHGPFVRRPEGGGSIPQSVFLSDGSNYSTEAQIEASNLALLHYGYARPEDRQAKFARYSAGRGHNPMHIASITQRPVLASWKGMVPLA